MLLRYINENNERGGEVNSGGYNIPLRFASRYIYPPLFAAAEGDSCFSIYQISWIKVKK